MKTEEEILEQRIEGIIDSHWQTFANFVNTSAAAKEIIDIMKSERNKTIDEAIDIVTDYQDYNPLIIERLKAMKV